ncbi:MAG: GNAT family N-acetyltransferase [Patescibacteria group bacterium]|jgi:GNAT superfamily N-acetyltransferase
MKVYMTSISGFTMRFAERNDVPLIFGFIKALAKYEKMLDRVIATEEKLAKTLFDEKQAEVIIAEEQGNPVGFALFYNTYSTFQGKANLFLEDLFIYPEFRGKGYGKMLLSFLAQVATERNYSRIDWWCLNWNLSSIGFYEKMGAVQQKEWSVFRLQDEKILELAILMKAK